MNSFPGAFPLVPALESLFAIRQLTASDSKVYTSASPLLLLNPLQGPGGGGGRQERGCALASQAHRDPVPGSSVRMVLPSYLLASPSPPELQTLVFLNSDGSALLILPIPRALSEGDLPSPLLPFSRPPSSSPSPAGQSPVLQEPLGCGITIAF